MLKSPYRLQSRGPVGKAWDRFADWLKNTRVGWTWLAIVLPFQIVSVWTNYVGMSLAMPNTAAIIFGAALQVAALYIGFHVIKSNAEQRSGWRIALAPVLCASIFFSFAGFVETYSIFVDSQTMPLKQRDDLRTQALALSGKVDEGRRLAISKMRNRIDESDDIISRVRQKISQGLYRDPQDGYAMIAEQQSRKQSAEDTIAGWSSFQFVPQQAVDAPTVSAGFESLQSSYGEFSKLMGMLRKDEVEGFEMPDPPLPKLNAMAAAPQKDKLEYAVTQAVTLRGFGFLFLAALLEAIPFLLAHGRAAMEEAGEAADQPEEPRGAEDVPKALAQPYYAVPSASEHDQEILERVERFLSSRRVATTAGADTMAEIEELMEAAQPSVSGFQSAVRTHMDNERLELWSEEESRRLRMFVEKVRAVEHEPLGEVLAVNEFGRRLAREMGYEEAAVAFQRRIDMLKDRMTGEQPRLSAPQSDAALDS